MRTALAASDDPAYAGLDAADVEGVNLDAERDTDGDGVSDLVESRAPNGGDGNGDGVQDGLQAGVASLASVGCGYMTVAVGGGCGELRDVRPIREAGVGERDAAFSYPCGLVGLERACATATVSVAYHGGASLAGGTYRRRGPLLPGGTPDVWSSFAGGSVVPGATPPHIEATLGDGLYGDDTAADGRIVHRAGPGLPQQGPEEVPVAAAAALALLASVLALAGALHAGRCRG